MNDINNTIDRQEIGGIKNITNIRWFALLLEIIPLVLCIGTLVFSSLDYFPLMFMFLFSVYLFGGWYIFKTDKYRVKDIIFSIISVILFLFPLLVGVLYKILAWPGANEMIVISIYGVIIYIFIALAWYYFHRTNPLQRILGFKILIRIVIFLLFSFWLFPLLQLFLN